MKKLYLYARLYTGFAFVFLLLTSLLPTRLKAQSNPVAQPLPFTQNFSSFTGSVTTYPAGLQGWTISGSTGPTFPTAAPAADQALVAGANSLTSGFVGDMNGKIGFLCTSAAQKSVALALNTSSTTTITVSYTAATQRQETGARIGAIGLQYRIGVSGTFTNVSGSEYQNPGGSTNTSGTNTISPQTISVSLPAECENQPIVQLRWVYREVSGGGNRPGFSVDDIIINGNTGGGPTPAITINSTGLTSFSSITGTASPAQTITISGTNLTDPISITPPTPYEISIDGGANYSTSALQLTPTTGSVTNASVNIRIASSAPAGTASGNLVAASTGASAQSVLLSGNVGSGVTVDPPLTFTATPVTSSAINLAATFSTTANNILIASNSSATFGTPTGALVAGNTISGGGTVLYNGPSASFTGFQHTGLNAATKYYYQAWSVDNANNYSTALAANATTNTPPAARVVINQVYGGGGNSGATFKNDFIELYNDDDTAVNLAGWSVQYGGGTGTGTFTVHALSGTIQPHNFFLIQESAGLGGTINLPTPDAIGTLSLGAAAGKVLLCNSTSQQSGSNPANNGTTILVIRDKVGFGAANGFETAPTAAPDNTTSVQRNTDGVDSDNNSADFFVGTPVPRNSSYKTTPPSVVTLTPPTNRLDVPSTLGLSILFDKKMVKGSGTITIYENGVAGTPIDVNDASIAISSNTLATINTTLSPGKSYYILVTPGAFADVYGNNFAGLTSNTSWAFSTYNSTVPVALPQTFDFNTCSGSGLLPSGFTQYSVTGAQKWDCANSARNSTSGLIMNGYANGINNLNEDWLISPKLDLTGTTFPLLSFWSYNGYAGDQLVLKVSTDYTGTGNPNLATWTDLNGKFPSTGSAVWQQSNNINLSNYKQTSVYLAWVYKSTTEDGSLWMVDDVNLVNSTVAPPPTITVNTGNIEFFFTAAGSTTVKQFTVLGNDLAGGGGINITSADGSFLVSKDNSAFASSINFTEAEANNTQKTVYVQFAPAQTNKNYSTSITVNTAGTPDTLIAVKGTSVDPANTLEVVNWNMEWFHTPDPTLGPKNKDLQATNAATVLSSIGADLFALVEVVDTAALGNIVRNNMPGYGYVICNYGSHGNPFESGYSPMNTLQKEAFVYKTSVFSNIDTASLLSNGINTAGDLTNPNYNYWSSGRYPFMMKADVTLNGVTKTIRFVAVHAKANTSPILDAYTRRQNGAVALHDYLNTTYPNDNIVILGDFNDDLDSTITDGISPKYSSYKVFTDDASNFYSPTLVGLSLTGKKSTVSYSDVIDHVVVSNEMQPFYMGASAAVLTDVTSQIASYGTTTSDHYPVFTRYAFDAALLPVKLESFTAVKDGNTVKVAWKSTEEINSSDYIVQRSADGVSFTNIGQVNAKGYAADYSLIDANPIVGDNYYRLKPVDKDGKFTYSKVVKVNFTKLPGIRISPNPASSYLYISLENINSPVNLQLVNINGQVVKQTIITQNLANKSISLVGLAKGLYSIKLVSQEKVTTQKLIIQ